jgi:alanine dehydrogenase
MAEQVLLHGEPVWLIREQEVAQVLTMERALQVVEAAFRDWAHGRATNSPRQRVHTPQGTLHLMGAAWHSKGYIGYKAYLSFPTGTRFHVFLASASSGQPLALIEADTLGQIRTGAATGVATRYLAREDATRVALIGTGIRRRASFRRSAPCAPSNRCGHSAAHPNACTPSANR